jgi:predicted metal-dependent HD superfamily phosphohydrolase
MTNEAIANLSPTERYEQMPRPLKYVRPRIHLERAIWLKDVLEDIQDQDFEELSKLRKAGRSEADPEIAELRQSLDHAAQTIRDLSLGLIDLAGPVKEE